MSSSISSCSSYSSYTSIESSPSPEIEPFSSVKQCFSEQQVQEIKDAFFKEAYAICLVMQKNKAPYHDGIQHAFIGQSSVFFQNKIAQKLKLLLVLGSNAGCHEDLFSTDLLLPIFQRLNTEKIEHFTTQFHPCFSIKGIGLCQSRMMEHMDLVYNNESDYLFAAIPLQNTPSCPVGDVLLYSIEDLSAENELFLFPCILLGFCIDRGIATLDVYTKQDNRVTKKTGIAELESVCERKSSSNTPFLKIRL